MGAFRRYLAAGALGLSSLVGSSYADEPKSEQPISELVSSYDPSSESFTNVKTSDEKVTIDTLSYRGTSRGMTIVDAKITDANGDKPTIVGVHLVDMPYTRGRLQLFRFIKGDEGVDYSFIPGKSESEDKEAVRLLHPEASSITISGSLEELVWEKKMDSTLFPKDSPEYPKTRALLAKYSELVKFNDYIKRTSPKNIEPFMRFLPDNVILTRPGKLYWRAVPKIFETGKIPLPRFSPELTFSLSTLQSISGEDGPANGGRSGIAAGFTISPQDKKDQPISVTAGNFSLYYGDIHGVIEYTLNSKTKFNIEFNDKDGDGTLDQITMGEAYKELYFSAEDEKILVEGAFSQMYTPATAEEIFNHARKIYSNVLGTFKDEYSTLQLSNSVLKLLPLREQKK